MKIALSGCAVALVLVGCNSGATPMMTDELSVITPLPAPTNGGLRDPSVRPLNPMGGVKDPSIKPIAPVRPNTIGGVADDGVKPVPR